MNSRRWSQLTKTIVMATLAILAIVLLITFREMIAPTIVAFLLAFILSYPTNWIQQRTGWPRGATVAVIYVMLLGLLALGSALLYPRGDEFLHAFQRLLEDLAAYLQTAVTGPIVTIGNYQLSINNLLQNAGDIVQSILLRSGTNPLSFFRGVTTGVLTVLYVLVLSFWVLKDLQTLRRLLVKQVPGDYQEDVRRLGYELSEIWHAFLRGQLVLAVVIAIVTWCMLWLLGVQNATGLAILAGIMEFLPTIGPGTSLTIGTIVAFFGGSTWSIFSNNFTFALLVFLTYNIITWIESAYLIPRLVGGRVRLHPAVTFVGIINSAIAFGLMGVLLATPVIASARVILVYIYRKIFDLEPFESSDTVQDSIRIRGLLGGRKIQGIVFDLDGTLTQLDLGAIEWVAERTGWLDTVISKDRRRAITRLFMIRLESTVNFLVNQLWRFERLKTLARFQPLFDHVRGYQPAAELELLPGVEATIRYLARTYQLALVSTRERSTVIDLLQRTKLDDGLFAAVIAREDVHNLMPHSEALIRAGEIMQVDPASMLVVSDTDPVLRSGSAAGMATVGVLCGLDRQAELLSCDLVLHTTAELTDWL